MIERILRRWGTELILQQSGAEFRLRGLIFHSSSKSWQNMEHSYTPLGRVPRGQYVYIGPVQPAAAVGDTLVQGDTAYVIRRVERMWLQDTPVYCWGLCVEKGSEVI